MTSALSTLRQSFSPLKDGNFRIYLSGQAVSLIGTWLQVTAQGWVVWTLTGLNAELGKVNMFATLPLLLLSPWTGAIADRFDRRKLLIGTQAVAMLLAFILALLVQTNSVRIEHVYVLSFLLGVVNALDFPAQQAFLGDLSGIGEVRKAVNLNITMLQMSRIFGPAVAGFLIGSLGIAPAFWINGLSFIAVIISLVFVRSNQVRSNKVELGSDGKSTSTFSAALRFIREQPRMIDLIIFTIITTFFGLSIILNILPAVAETILHGDANTLGVITAASGAGALIGVSIVAPLVQAMKRTGMILSIALVWMGFWFLGFAAAITIPAAFFTLFMVSIAPPVIIPTANGLIQIMSPPSMRARILSIFVMVSFGMQPVAAVVIGYSADQFGLPATIAMNAVALIICGVIMVLRPVLRSWDTTRLSEPSVVVAPALESI